jgi:hypothetical protein
VEKAWRGSSDKPLRLIGSYDNVLNGVAFYLSDRPSTVEIVTATRTPWADEVRVKRDGIALVCPMAVSVCMGAIEKRVAADPDAKRVEVEISRSYFGIAGVPARYLIVVVPPQP